MNTCALCGCQIRLDQSAWVDHTGGDVCEGTHQHVPADDPRMVSFEWSEGSARWGNATPETIDAALEALTAILGQPATIT